MEIEKMSSSGCQEYAKIISIGSIRINCCIPPFNLQYALIPSGKKEKVDENLNNREINTTYCFSHVRREIRWFELHSVNVCYRER